MTPVARANAALHTPLCDMLKIDVPILLAGMGGASGVELTAAVSNAGGLGVLGCTGRTPEEMREWIVKTRELTDRPFGVDIILPAQMSRDAVTWKDLIGKIPEAHRNYVGELQKKFNLPEVTPEQIEKYFEGRPALGTGIDAQVEVVLDEKIPVFVSGLGSPGFMVERAHAQGMTVISIVGNVRAARKVMADGVDVVVAQGHDGGGHTGRIGTFVLIPQVIDAVKPLPVIAAGGVADGRGLAAALAFGCQAVWVGTRFLATPEAQISDWKKDQIVEATDGSTRITYAYTGKPCRSMRNGWVDAWESAPVDPLPMPLQPALVRPILAADPENPNVQANLVGQAVGMIHEIKPAGEVVAEMANEAAEILGRLGGPESG